MMEEIKDLLRELKNPVLLVALGAMIVLILLLALGVLRQILRALTLRAGGQGLLRAVGLKRRLAVIALSHVLLGKRQGGH